MFFALKVGSDVEDEEQDVSVTCHLCLQAVCYRILAVMTIPLILSLFKVL